MTAIAMTAMIQRVLDESLAIFVDEESLHAASPPGRALQASAGWCGRPLPISYGGTRRALTERS